MPVQASLPNPLEHMRRRVRALPEPMGPTSGGRNGPAPALPSPNRRTFDVGNYETRVDTAMGKNGMAPSAGAMTKALPNPYTQAESQSRNPLLSAAISGFMRGYDPAQWQSDQDRQKAEGVEKGKKLLALAQQQRSIPEAQRAQWWQANAPMIGQLTGVDTTQPVDPAQFTDQALDGHIAALTGQLGIVSEPMSEYQKAQLAQKEAEMGKPQLFSTSKGIVSVAPGQEPDLVYGTEDDEKPPWTGAIKNPQTGQWEFDPNYIKGYRQMHPGSAQGGNTPPSGYRWVRGADGQAALEKIPGGPADKPEIEYTPAQRDKLKKQANALGSIQFAVDEYRDAVDKYGTRLIANPNDPDTAELEAAHTNLMMLLKSPEMFALGVLTGPDLDILEKSVTPPTGMKSFGANAETINRRLGVLDRFIAQQRGRIPEQFIEQLTPQPKGLQGVRSLIDRTQARQRLAQPQAQQPDQSGDIDPEIERILDEALGPDEEEGGLSPDEEAELQKLRQEFGIQ